MPQKTVLDNGLCLVTEAMPHARSICMSIFIGAGSRYERPEEAGISHFAEHMFFKGTQKRPTSKEISEAIEGVGGMLNGGTDRELTSYWTRVARLHFPIALDVLGDMLRHSHFSPQGIDKERQVILEELKAIHDSPQQRADLLIDEVLWPNQPLGRDVAGSQETVSALTRESLLDYVGRQYSPNNAVVSVAGDIDHAAVVEALALAFGDWPRSCPTPWIPAQDEQDSPQVRVEARDTEQAYLCLAVRGVSIHHPDRFVLDLLNVVLGEGMSSRLFLELRERQGLAYEVHSYISHFLDSGAATICAVTDPRKVEVMVAGLLRELRRLREEEVSESELLKARELTKGRLLLRMEDTRSVSGWMGAQQLLLGRIYGVDEVMNIVDAISAQDILRVAQSLFLTEKLNLAVVGAFRGEGRLDSLLSL